jgi:flagellum-specific peptidoglycan hydrolase FlgJ
MTKPSDKLARIWLEARDEGTPGKFKSLRQYPGLPAYWLSPENMATYMNAPDPVSLYLNPNPTPIPYSYPTSALHLPQFSSEDIREKNVKKREARAMKREDEYVRRTMAEHFKYDLYQKHANKYLSRPTFEGTPLTGSMLADIAKDTLLKTGVLVPLELVLSQAQFETSMGRKGRNPITNPFNVGEYDEGTKLKFKTTREGVQAYFNLIAKNYLKGKTLDDLLTNFVNEQGNRYATDKAYEQKIKRQIDYIRKFLSKGGLK